MNDKGLSLLPFCIPCGAKCCQASPLFLEEDKQILEKDFPEAIFKDMNGYYIIDQEPCFFLNEGRCSIEGRKPKDCLMWPVSFSMKEGKKAWTLDKNCPATATLKKEFIEKAKEVANSIPEEVHERYRQEYESKHLSTEEE